MKNYPRKYEYVFTGRDLINKKCKINEVSVYNNDPSSVNEYINLFRETFRKFEADYFDSLVKIEWLSRRFCYHGYRRARNIGNGVDIDRAFGVFIRSFVGHDKRLFVLEKSTLSKVITYLDDFFPNFNEGNPFKEEYKYPYKVMTLECLSVVYQMDERLELLDYCDKKNMTYTEFLDYVVNYINCLNEEKGDIYTFIFKYGLPYIKNNYEES
jgi:hypothetical protein